MKKITLKQLREKNGYTQEKASLKLKITKEYLSMLERAERNPSDKLKEDMANLYNCTVVDIYLAYKETKCFKEQLKMKQNEVNLV